MSKLSNIAQTQKAKKQYNHMIIDILLERHSKEELQNILHCSNRKARQIVAECSMYYPIIALSEGKGGYRRAGNIDALEGEFLEEEIILVKRTISEHRSRIKCLKKKMKPLIAWLKVAEKKQGGYLDD